MTITSKARAKARTIETIRQIENLKLKERLKEIEFMQRYNICPKDGEELQIKELALLKGIWFFLALFLFHTTPQMMNICPKCGEGYNL